MHWQIVGVGGNVILAIFVTSNRQTPYLLKIGFHVFRQFFEQLSEERPEQGTSEVKPLVSIMISIVEGPLAQGSQ